MTATVSKHRIMVATALVVLATSGVGLPATAIAAPTAPAAAPILKVTNSCYDQGHDDGWWDGWWDSLAGSETLFVPDPPAECHDTVDYNDYVSGYLTGYGASY